MHETDCMLCTINEALRNAESCPYPTPGISGHFWKIQELPTSIVVLAPNQYYPGYTLVIAKTHATELYHLSDHESTRYFQDMLRVAKAIATAFQPQKMNYELLGNTGAHLHWHLFPRYRWDPNPRHPVWQHTHEPKLLSHQEYAETTAAIRRELS